MNDLTYKIIVFKIRTKIMRLPLILLAILRTHLSVEELPKFCFMSPERRKKRFFELVELILGTRVYNFSLGFGGEGIDNCEYI